MARAYEHFQTACLLGKRTVAEIIRDSRTPCPEVIVSHTVLGKSAFQSSTPLPRSPPKPVLKVRFLLCSYASVSFIVSCFLRNDDIRKKLRRKEQKGIPFIISKTSASCRIRFSWKHARILLANIPPRKLSQRRVTAQNSVKPIFTFLSQIWIFCLLF